AGRSQRLQLLPARGEHIDRLLSPRNHPVPSALLRRDVDFGDLQLALAPRGREYDLLAALAPEQRLADRRLVRQSQLPRVGLSRADDRVFGRLAALVLDVDDGADADDVGAEVGLIDHRSGAELLLELGNP